jgi:hypothetical protein
MNDLKFAGLGDDVKRVGLTVKDATARLLRLVYLEKRVMFYGAAKLVPVPDRDLKTFLGKLQYHAAERSELLRNRLRQMRVPKVRFDATPDPGLEILMDEAMHSHGNFEVAETAFWLHKWLLEAYEKYLSETNPLADAPTCDAIEALLPRLREVVKWLDGYLNSGEAPRDRSQRLHSFLVAAGGMDGTQPRSESLAARDRSNEAFVLARTPGRDASIPRVWDYIKPPMEAVSDFLVFMIGIRLSEINVAEGLSVVLFNSPGMPWEFYHDISRHLWDEVRHSVMGEAAALVTFGTLGKTPMREYESAYCMESEPLEQYATLGLEIEGAQMKYPVGKRGEWEFCRDAAKNALMTTFQDYDWADEVLHVNIAKRRLADWFPNGLQELSAYAGRGKANRAQVKARKAPVSLSDSSLSSSASKKPGLEVSDEDAASSGLEVDDDTPHGG